MTATAVMMAATGVFRSGRVSRTLADYVRLRCHWIETSSVATSGVIAADEAVQTVTQDCHDAVKRRESQRYQSDVLANQNDLNIPYAWSGYCPITSVVDSKGADAAHGGDYTKSLTLRIMRIMQLDCKSLPNQIFKFPWSMGYPCKSRDDCFEQI